jgi:ATP-dependent Clp protease ATP-binding subunit ClpA
VVRAATRKASPAVPKTRSTYSPTPTAGSASTSETLNAFKTRPAAPKKKRGKADLLSLESLLDGTSKSLNSGRKTNKEIAEMVDRDLAELERRQLGGTVSSESSDDEVKDEDVDEEVHERVLGAEQAGKVSRMLKSDRSNIVKVVPWRPFWAADNGSGDEAMDANVSVARFFELGRLTII